MKIPHERFFVLVTHDMLFKYSDLIAQERLNCSLYVGAHNFLDTVKKAEINKLKSFFTEHGLGLIIHGPFVDLNPGSLDEKIRKASLDRLTETVAATKMLGSKHVTFHSGFKPEPYSKYEKEWLQNSVETWGRVLDAAGKENIKLTVENAFEKEPSALIELVKTVDSPNFNICFDGGHYNAFSNTPPLEAFDMLPPDKIGEIHLSDNDGSSDQHLPLGEGNIDLDALFKKIEQLRMEPLITLEPKDIAGAKESMAYLKKKGIID